MKDMDILCDNMILCNYIFKIKQAKEILLHKTIPTFNLNRAIETIYKEKNSNETITKIEAGCNGKWTILTELSDIKVQVFGKRKNVNYQPFKVTCNPTNLMKYDLATELLNYDSDCTVSYRVTFNIDIGDVSHMIVNQVISRTYACDKCYNKTKKDNKVILYCKRCGYTNPLHFQNSLSHVTYYDEFLTIDFVKHDIDMLCYDIEAYHAKTRRDQTIN